MSFRQVPSPCRNLLYFYSTGYFYHDIDTNAAYICNNFNMFPLIFQLFADILNKILIMSPVWLILFIRKGS